MKKFNFILIVISFCLIIFGSYNIFINKYHSVIEDDLFFIIISVLILFIYYTLSKKKYFNYLITLNNLQFPNFEKLVHNLKEKYDYEVEYDTINDNHVYLYLDNIRINCGLYDVKIPKDVLREANLYALGEFDKKEVLDHDSHLDLYVNYSRKNEVKPKELEKFMYRMISEILNLTNSIGVYNSKDFVLKHKEHKLYLKDYFIHKVSNEEFNQLK